MAAIGECGLGRRKGSNPEQRDKWRDTIWDRGGKRQRFLLGCGRSAGVGGVGGPCDEVFKALEKNPLLILEGKESGSSLSRAGTGSRPCFQKS